MAKRKIAYIIILLFVLEINILYIDYELFILLLALVVFPALLYIGLRLQVRDLDIQIKAESSVITEGNTIKCIIEIKNKSLFPISNLEMNLMVHYDNYDVNTIQTVSISPEGKSELILTKEIQLNVCGNTKIGIENIFMYDYIALFRVKCGCDGYSETTVMPKLIQKSYQRERIGNIESSEKEGGSLQGMDSSEILELRKYAEGDRLNRIHWKLSSRTDDFIVKEFAGETSAPKLILVELSSEFQSGKIQYINPVYQMVYALGNYLCSYVQEFHIAYFNLEANRLQEILIGDRKQLDFAMRQLMKLKVYQQDRAKTAFLNRSNKDTCCVYYVKNAHDLVLPGDSVKDSRNTQSDFAVSLTVNDKNIQSLVDSFYLNM